MSDVWKCTLDCHLTATNPTPQNVQCTYYTMLEVQFHYRSDTHADQQFAAFPRVGCQITRTCECVTDYT